MAMHITKEIFVNRFDIKISIVATKAFKKELFDPDVAIASHLH